MTYIEDTCLLLGMPLLLAFLIVCFHYNWYKLMVSVLVVLGISVPLYFSLATYEIKPETDGVHVYQRCDFNRSHEQVGDSVTTLKIGNVINEYERNKHYQPYQTIHILHLKNGHVAVYSGRRCFIEESPMVEICKFEDAKGYIVDLLRYTDLTGETCYWDMYRNEQVEQLENFVLPSYYIDPTIYVSNYLAACKKQSVIDADIEAKIQAWKDSGLTLPEELETLEKWRKQDKAAVIDAFSDTLKFGTAGLRAPMGPGTNRMSKYTVALATQGFANYLIKKNPNCCFYVVVGYDCRHNSKEFANVAADVFSANGIYVYLCDDMRPTPEISFAIRELRCMAGVNITASHNSKEYNGYKAYLNDGGQIVPPADNEIVDEAAKIQLQDIKHTRNPELVDTTTIKEKLDKKYIAIMDSAIIDTDAFKMASELKIVYSPMHGAGYKIVPGCLAAHGIKHVSLVPEQLPDNGQFASVSHTERHEANPEDEQAMQLLKNQAEKEKADLAIATDPDADRFGFYCQDSNGKLQRIDGHQSTMLFTQYIINTRNCLGLMPENPFMGRTIVTSEIVKRIADSAHIKMYDEYTGFKWIAHRIDTLGKMAPDHTFIGAGEESFCYLPYDKVRDKDAPASICLLAEMTASAKMKGTTLWDELMNIYLKYGFQREYTLKWTIKAHNNKSWKDNTVLIMDLFRDNIKDHICGDPIRNTLDYSQPTVAEMRDLPQTDNTLQYFTESGVKLTIRPSGTEPKLKIYMEIPSTKFSSAKQYEDAIADTEKTKAKIEKELKKILKHNKYKVL